MSEKTARFDMPSACRAVTAAYLSSSDLRMPDSLIFGSTPINGGFVWFGVWDVAAFALLIAAQDDDDDDATSAAVLCGASSFGGAEDDVVDGDIGHVVAKQMSRYHVQQLLCSPGIQSVEWAVQSPSFRRGARSERNIIVIGISKNKTKIF